MSLWNLLAIAEVLENTYTVMFQKIAKKFAPGDDRTHGLQLWDWRAAYCATKAVL